jgi:hypothetical protein
VFGRRLERRVQGHLFAIDEDVAEDNGEEADDASYGDGQEYEARRLDIEMVHVAKCKGHAGEEAEENTEIDGNVEAEEHDNRLREEHVDGSNDGYSGKHGELGAQGNLGRELQAPFLGGSSFDNGVEGFSEKRQLDHAEDGEEDERPLRPAPSFSADDE